MINVTKTYLPDIDKYKSYVDKIFSNCWITNDGPLVRELEQRLTTYLGVKNLLLVSNGTVALEIAYRALELRNSVITTPFSFVATTSSLVTNNLTPIFSDIEPHTFNIDPIEIENNLLENVSGIVATHVFGNPCDIETIDNIASQHNLKVIYDGAHAFDIKYKDIDVTNYGDITTLSFHATKLFHTVEGGAIIINNNVDLVQKVKYLRNFGIAGPDNIPEIGINAKMNEFEAAMGLCILDDIADIIEKRKMISEIYYSELKEIVSFQKVNSFATKNYSFFPILFDSEIKLLKAVSILNKNNIFPRRYFYPSLDTLSYIQPKQNMMISRDIAKRVLCLPMYHELTESDLCQITQSIKNI